MITGMTIGAGILGIPYVVAQVGLTTGLIFIFCLGFTMLALNLMIGEIAARTGENFQLPGLAGRYLGVWAKRFLSVIMLFGSYGAMLAYVVGEGEALSAVFGGSPVWWSVFFWSVGSFVIWRGLTTLKKVEQILSFTVIMAITFLSFYFLKHNTGFDWKYFDSAKFFMPFGVILFALNASPAIAEAHAILPGSERHFRRAVIIGTLIPMFVYMLFALAVVGATGRFTTEVATVGLAGIFGQRIVVLSNLFAILAMGTAFMGVGMAVKQIWAWDYKLPKWLADVAVMIVPITLFLLGLRSFFLILDFVGGFFIGIEALLMVAVCFVARRRGDIQITRYRALPFWLLAAPVIFVFTLATVYSVIKMVV